MSKYTVLRHRNDWLSNYKGQIFNAKLNEEIFKGVISEHAKYKSGNQNFVEQLGKKCLVTCIDPITMELESIGASSLLRDEITGQIIDNLILDNFGLFFSRLITNGSGGGAVTLTTDTGGGAGVNIYANSNFEFNRKTAAALPSLSVIQMGSSSTTPARDNFAIFAALPNPPEDDYLSTNLGAYTGVNTVIYQADANPTGGSGTVKEAGSFQKWYNSGGTESTFMLTHDAVSPNVPYTSGKLLRAAYVWVI